MARKTLGAGFTGDVTEERGISAKAKGAARYVKEEAEMVAAHAADHPAASGSAVAFVGVLGFVLGYICGTSSASRHRW